MRIRLPIGRNYSAHVIGSLAALAVAGGIAGYLYFSRGYNQPPREPTAVTEPAPLIVPSVVDLSMATATPSEVTPTVQPEDTNTQPTPVTEVKPFELVCDFCTPEQLETFSANAKEDYLEVLKVYGIDERDAKIVVSVDETGYSPGFYYGGRSGGARGMGPDDFVRDRREVRHEMAHAINHSLLGSDLPSWLDEGLAMYGSGEIDTGLQGGGSIWLYDNPNRPNEATPYSVNEAFTILRNNPADYWKRRGPADVPGHIIGWYFYALMIRDYHMTPGQNRTAIRTIRDIISLSRSPLTKKIIQASYESALGTNLDHLFNDLLAPGVNILYTDQEVRNDFGIK